MGRYYQTLGVRAEGERELNPNQPSSSSGDSTGRERHLADTRSTNSKGAIPPALSDSDFIHPRSAPRSPA